MTDFQIERCRTCSNAPIIWALTKRNNAIPVDAEPDPLRGNIDLSIRDGVVRADILKPSASRNDLRVSHFATCPKAKEWRNR